jgi:hypothetical protein
LRVGLELNGTSGAGDARVVGEDHLAETARSELDGDVATFESGLRSGDGRSGVASTGLGFDTRG